MRFRRTFAQPEEVPRIWGLALVACFLGGLLAVGGVSMTLYQNALTDILLQTKEQVLWKYASRAAIMFQPGRQGLGEELNRLRSEQGLNSCTLVGTDGQAIPGLISNTPAIEESPVRAHPNRVVQFAIPVVDGAGRKLGELRAGYAIPIAPWNKKQAAVWLGLVVLASLTLLLVLYRILRRTLRPMSKVRDRLILYRDELQTRLHELSIEGEKGLLVAAWNKLIQTANELQTALASTESKSELAEALRSHDDNQAHEVLDWHPDGLLLIDEFGQVLMLNRACRSLLRMAGDSTIGKPVGQLGADPELNQVIERLVSSSSKNNRATIYHTMHGEGHATTLSLTVVHIRAQDKPGGLLLVCRDASQQKQAEKARDDFLHQVTHEFRTPLSNIRAYTETLMEGILEDKDAQRECLNVINSEAKRLGRLVEEVLTASQLEVGTARLRLGPVNLARLLQKAIQDLQATADEKNVELSLTLPPKVPGIQADKDRLAVVLNNLLGNAVKYTASGGTVSLECQHSDSDLEISVTDTGMGIAKEHLPHIFDKFYRADCQAIQDLPGTGLGLATARQIARLHGGEITAQSKHGEGSQFLLTLPVYELGTGTASIASHEPNETLESPQDLHEHNEIAAHPTETGT